MNRRNFIRSTAGLLVAPWVVKAENLMPVKAIDTISSHDVLWYRFLQQVASAHSVQASELERDYSYTQIMHIRNSL